MATHAWPANRVWRFRRKNSRKWRLTWLRFTALPTLRLTVKPMRPSVSVVCSAKNRKKRPLSLRPAAVTRRKSAFSSKRADLGNEKSSSGCGSEILKTLYSYTTIRRLRPLALRRERIFLPLAVAMRARKPWLRLRRIRLGWKVLFTFVILVHLFQPTKSGHRLRTRHCDGFFIKLQQFVYISKIGYISI